MKLSSALMYAGNPRDAADQVASLEKAGLDTIWVAEAYGFDSPTLMGYLAAKTETIEIGSAILNVYSRTPGALLQTAAGLDNVSGGRAIIGLGASGPQVIEGFHGLPYATPVARTREVIDIIRSGMRREPLTSDGIFHLPLTKEHGGNGLGKALKILVHPQRSSVPLYVAALGGKSVEGAAEYADGWLPFLYHPERASQVWGDSLALGAARRPDALAPLEVVAGGMCAIGEGPETKSLLDFARPLVALYVGGMGARGKNFYNDLFVSYGYEAEAKEIQDLYLDGKKREAEAAIPLDFLEAMNLVGPESYVKERIEAFRESGVTNLQITPAADDAPALVAKMKELIGG
ncbi:LLM class F420-dependent oxidoreductase [Nocardioides baekrokdamisoli]|uniref:LLM class F420-dependent oxidoreductase n=1 Tax=Nocardioides baekrokdamisoli TaxID=1804624 RepID=A0A3G9IN42_9ACTN|nr:LLM class F420-dependent oxidoreductase [Nocardioides baekrokdamisoli]BBH17445.1 LLM class F420-dependent oxidoreductase [Nocardioides baekrokdamisoli]